ncbi:hypothetical protein C8E05_0898 [Rhodococcus wratislaviensis]|uniref:Uncharacterized protein n=1 Tax=Rhodococcus wratislaviensis TaxID=44752 RepID=A0AB38FGH3_RHOWR|nr:hypothetical protein C8E05_0898 [Rhodococcus wratislaviensis]SPZ40465.1 Uncharacterised protein [Rhodococcus wratislaviensis]
MYIEVTSDGFWTRHLLDLKAFHVRIRCDREKAHQSLVRAKIGYIDNDAVFIRSAWLRNQGPRTREWREDFGAMLSYAGDRGWYDGEFIEGHIEPN